MMKKVLLIIGAVILVAIIGGGIWLYSNADMIANKGIEVIFDGAQEVVLKDLPSNYGVEEVKQLFSKAKTIAIEKGFSSPELQSFAQTFQDVTADEKVDSVELEQVIENLKFIIGE